MKLNSYPGAIAAAAQYVTELESQLTRLRFTVSNIEDGADLVIAFDPDLKNEMQRKARRTEILMVDSEHQNASERLIALVQQKATALNKLEELRNEFSVAKLEARMTIAQSLTGVESRELVGI